MAHSKQITEGNFIKQMLTKVWKVKELTSHWKYPNRRNWAMFTCLELAPGMRAQGGHGVGLGGTGGAGAGRKIWNVS